MAIADGKVIIQIDADSKGFEADLNNASYKNFTAFIFFVFAENHPASILTEYPIPKNCNNAKIIALIILITRMAELGFPNPLRISITKFVC